MLIFIFWHLIATLAIVPFNPPAAENQQAVRVTVMGINQKRGEIFAALYQGEKGFPGDATKAFRTAKATPRNGEAQLTFDQVPPGTYAIALFHDENGDEVLNTNIIGIPKEGYGVSNNVKNLFSGPTYKQAAFRHQATTQLTIQLRY